MCRRLVVRRWGSRGRRGMSLVEVMVVIAIVLTMTAILAFGVFAVFNQSRASTTELTLGKVGQQIEVYALSRGGPPTESEGLGVLPGDVPPDSWGRPLIYRSPGPGGAAFAVLSYGADGEEGGGDLDEDLVFTSESR